MRNKSGIDCKSQKAGRKTNGVALPKVPASYLIQRISASCGFSFSKSDESVSAMDVFWIESGFELGFTFNANGP